MSDASHAGITVSDLERSLRFYGDALGMQQVRRYTSNLAMAKPMWKAPGLERLESAVVQIPSTPQQLQLTQADGQFDARRPRLDTAPWDLGAAHLAMVVDDLDTTLARLADHGVTPRTGAAVRIVADHSGTPWVGALVADPDGFELDLVQPPQPGDRLVAFGVVVSELDDSIAFYRDVLGLELVVRKAEDRDFLTARWGCDAIESAEMALMAKPGMVQVLKLLAVRGPEQRRVISKQWDVGFAHLCYAVDHFDDMLRSLAGKGLEPRAAVRDSPAWAAGGHVPDPDGFDLEVLQLT